MTSKVHALADEKPCKLPQNCNNQQRLSNNRLAT